MKFQKLKTRQKGYVLTVTNIVLGIFIVSPTSVIDLNVVASSTNFCRTILWNSIFKKYAETYLKIMKKIIEKGDDFVKTETARIEKNLEDKSIKEEVKIGMKSRKNILESFKYPTAHKRLIDEL